MNPHDTIKVVYRRALQADFEQMTRMVAANLKASLENTKDGFIQNAIPAAKFEAMNADLCVISAVEGDRLLGFICAETVEFNRDNKLVSEMVSRFHQVNFEGRPLSEYDTCVLGPVCVEKEYRGHGIFENLYQSIKEQTCDRFEVGVAFIAEENPRSLAAHHQKAGMHVVDNFLFDQRRYNAVALRLRP